MMSFLSLSLSQLIVPALVGVTVALILDTQLGNVSDRLLDRVAQNVYFRCLVLFGAAYAANGQKILPGLVAVYVYFVVVAGDITDDPFDAFDPRRWNLMRKKPPRAPSP